MFVYHEILNELIFILYRGYWGYPVWMTSFEFCRNLLSQHRPASLCVLRFQANNCNTRCGKSEDNLKYESSTILFPFLPHRIFIFNSHQKFSFQQVRIWYKVVEKWDCFTNPLFIFNFTDKFCFQFETLRPRPAWFTRNYFVL